MRIDKLVSLKVTDMPFHVYQCHNGFKINKNLYKATKDMNRNNSNYHMVFPKQPCKSN